MIYEELIGNCLQLNWEGWADEMGNIFTYDIHIIEVNPRSAFSYHDQYRTSYHGSDLYASIIDVPNLQRNFTGLYSCQSVFATRCTGKISELLDFTQIKREQDIHEDYQFVFLFKDRDFEIVDNCQSGARVLMRVFFSKPT